VALNTRCQGQRFPDQIMLRWHTLSSDFGRGGGGTSSGRGKIEDFH
jgi:hypothetical protein